MNTFKKDKVTNMSARTGRTESRESILSRFTSLTGKAIGFIEEGQRSPEMIDALLASLQMFRDNTLKMPIQPNELMRERVVSVIPDYAQERLSMMLDISSLAERVKTRLIKEEGILYVGEIYLRHWSYAAHENHIQSHFRRETDQFLASIGLPATGMLDLKEWGWKPPYDTAVIRTILDKPALTALKFNPDQLQYDRHMQRLKAKLEDKLIGHLFTKYRLDPTNFNRTYPLHAGMYFPDWTPPTK